MWLAVVKKERYLHRILYADDILLSAPSVTQLERLLRKCEEELSYLYMVINVKKSSCLRVGPRYNVRCREGMTENAGHEIAGHEFAIHANIVCKYITLQCSAHFF